MTEKEMIEEMAKIQCDSCKKYMGESEDCDSAECLFIRKKYANELIKQGYRKLPEGSVVLSKNEYEELNITGKYFNDALNQARKETAKEIIRDIKYTVEDRNGATLEEDLSVDATILKEVLDEIAKQFGVVKE